MAGNTRGKLKEHFEGIHKDFDWATFHCGKALGLIGEKHAHLTEAVKALAKGIEILDKAAQDIYSKL